ncbi:MAG: methylated-DNA--[protein]-cysteine S-methyltransferase [Clostridiales bacterium]|nr:methylated-DNA--[protein]-cysteine S-methyltransferase [Clostridiales bacterium]
MRGRPLDTEDCRKEETPVIRQAAQEITEYLEKKRTRFTIPLSLQGTEFQKRVWNALQEIPYGETRSYKQIAEAIQQPNAYRAVGMANNKNPVLIIIPCHRVIGAQGKLVGYAAGVDVKQYLLKLEQNG